ncbi:hypothetical protein DPMN_183858, partial [Dreissena polymorpha]
MKQYRLCIRPAYAAPDEAVAGKKPRRVHHGQATLLTMRGYTYNSHYQCWNRILKAFANSLDPDEKPKNVASHQDPNSKKALANSVDPDETPHDVASHQGLRCLLKGISCWNQILKAFANGLDPDETPQNMASHQDPN